MKAGWTISAIGHSAVLAWGLVTFVGRPAHMPPPPDFLSADIVSDADLSRITQGIRTAKLADVPKPLVEKIGEAKPTESPNAKVVDKPEIVPTADQLQPKPEPEKKPEPKKAEPKPPEPKPEPKQAFAKEEPKPDPIAEALKKDNTKPEKKPEKKAETPPPKKQEPKQQPKFSSSQIAALLDKRDPQRRAATGSILSDTPSLGTAKGAAVTLSQNELDALRRRLQKLLDRAARPRRARPRRDGANPVQQRRNAVDGAAGAQSRQPSGLPCGVRKRATRGAQLRTLHVPSRR